MKRRTPGLIMSEAAYTDIDALRASEVKSAARSTLAHLAHSMRQPREDTDAFRAGRALHCAVLRPADFVAEFITAPKCDRRTKDGKAMYDAVLAGAGGRDVLDEVTSRVNDGMAVSIAEHPSAAAALAMCSIREQVFLGEIAGVPAKCRVDALSTDGTILVDVKTSMSASPRAFARSCVEYGYALQFAFYRAILRQNGYAVDDCMIVAVEKSSPYLVACYRLPEETLDRAHAVVVRVVGEIERARETGVWPGYSDGVVDINLPPWAFTDEQEIAS